MDIWRNNIDIQTILFKPFLCTYALAKEIKVCISKLKSKNSVETHIPGTDGIQQDPTCYIMTQTSMPSFDRKKPIKNTEPSPFAVYLKRPVRNVNCKEVEIVVQDKVYTFSSTSFTG